MTRRGAQSGRLNFSSVRILLADKNPHYRKILHSMLRNFGAKNIFEAESFAAAGAIISATHLDLVLCDHGLADGSGLSLVRKTRMNKTSRNREIPFLVMAGDPSLELVEAARDAGANMVISKPVSPSALFDRLLWVASIQREFYETESYYGPDRRFRFEGFVAGTGRRKTDVDLGELDNLFTDAQKSDSEGYAA
ncbi:MAG: response regulator [Pseudolabrys sp.]